MSGAMGVIRSTEGLINGLAMGLAASHRPAPTYIHSGRAINAVHELVAEIQKERAANATLQSENAELRALAEDLMAQVLRLQTEVLERNPR